MSGSACSSDYRVRSSPALRNGVLALHVSTPHGLSGLVRLCRPQAHFQSPISPDYLSIPSSWPDGLPVRSLSGCLLISLYQGFCNYQAALKSMKFSFLKGAWEVPQCAPAEHSISFIYGDVQTQNDIISAEALSVYLTFGNLIILKTRGIVFYVSIKNCTPSCKPFSCIPYRFQGSIFFR